MKLPIVPEDKLGPFRSLLAYHGGELCGAAIISEETPWNLWLLGVAENCRSQGIGSALCREVEAEARRHGQKALRIRLNRVDYPAMARVVASLGWTWVEAVQARSGRGGETGLEERWIKLLDESPVTCILVGCGQRGQELHKAACSKGFQFVAACDPSPAGKAWAERQGMPCFAGLAAAWANGIRAQAAILALPHDLYRDVRSFCQERDLAVLQEKPLDITLLRAIESQHPRPAKLVLGVQRRSHPSYLFLRHLLAKRQISAVVLRSGLGFHDKRDGFRADIKVSGGGVVIDLGYHLLDLAHFLTGRPLELLAAAMLEQDVPITCASQMDDCATLSCRSGKAAILVKVDRGGRKGEDVLVECADGRFVATREGVWQLHETQPWPEFGEGPLGERLYECKKEWDMAVNGRLDLLRLATQENGDDALQGLFRRHQAWSDLATLRLVEQSRHLAMGSAQGWWP